MDGAAYMIVDEADGWMEQKQGINALLRIKGK